MHTLCLFFTYVLVHGFMEMVYAMAYGKRYLAMLQSLQPIRDRNIQVWYGAVSYAVLFITTFYVIVLQVYKSKKSLAESMVLGGMFGLCVYGVYNLTNMFAFSRYGTREAMSDTAYGVLSIAIVAGMTWWLRQEKRI